MLQIPPIHVIELTQIKILAGNYPDCAYLGAGSSKEKNIANPYFSGEPTNEAAVKVRVRAAGPPFPGISRPNESNFVLQKNIGIRPHRGSA
jgi:hypothetical protein